MNNIILPKLKPFSLRLSLSLVAADFGGRLSLSSDWSERTGSPGLGAVSSVLYMVDGALTKQTSELWHHWRVLKYLSEERFKD